MLIKSPRPDTFLRFERTDTDEYREITVTASLDGMAVSTGVWFDACEDFLRHLAEFERARRSAAVLRSEPEFTLAIQPNGSTGGAWLAFRLNRTVYLQFPPTGQPRTGSVTIDGGFPVAGEYVGALLSDFTRFLTVAPSG